MDNRHTHPVPARLSAAALDRFRVCPRMFHFQDVERVVVQEDASPQLVQANAIHAALERFYGLPFGDRTPETIEQCLRTVWIPSRRPGAFASELEEVAYGLEAIEMLQRHASCCDTHVKPIAREQWIQARLRTGTIFGKADRIDPLPGGGVEIVDYKTGRRQLQPDELADDTAALVYLVAAGTTTGRPVEGVRFIYLRSGDQVLWTPEPDDLDLIVEKLETILETIQTTTIWTGVPGEACRFCRFALTCPDRQSVSLTDLDPDASLVF